MSNFGDLFPGAVHVDLSPTNEDYAEIQPEARTVWYDRLGSRMLEGGAIGWLPIIFQRTDPRTAKEQIVDRYAHGGGWHPFTDKFTVRGDDLVYPGDPPYHPIAFSHLPLTSEVLIIYKGSWLKIEQLDGSYEIVQMD